MKTPLDIRMRYCAEAETKPPVIWEFISRWADEVTSLLAAKEELERQNAELIAELNRVVPDREHSPLPF